VSWAVCWVGWAFALAAAWTLRRRMERVADAEHELRGAATAIGLMVESSPGLRLQLDRMAAALADLAEARGAELPPSADLEAGRLAQVLGNVIANAAEHGVGPVEVRNRDRALRGRRGRGRGLAIAKRAARELGGRVSVRSEGGFTRAVIELPGPEADD
jgi:C4-dicarboxylate-specific signal transduction histidine kinase